MLYNYVPSPQWHWLPEREERSETGVSRKEIENSPRKVLADTAVAFALSLGIVLMIDVAVILVAFPLKMFHFD